MTDIPRERLMATEDIKNNFVSSFKTLSKDHVNIEFLGGIERFPTVTLTADGRALVKFETDLVPGDEFILYRETEIDSSDIYVEGQPLRSASLNAEHNRTSMLLEEMKMRVMDTIHKPEHGDDSVLTLPKIEERKNKFLYFDEDGNVKTSASGSEWVAGLEQLQNEIEDAIQASKDHVAALELPLTGDKIASQSITQDKIDPSVRLGGLSVGEDSLIRLNANVIEEDVIIEEYHNGMSAGPITIKSKNDLLKSEDLTDNTVWSLTEASVSIEDIPKPIQLSVVNKLKSSSSIMTRHYIDQVYSRSTSLGNVYVLSIFAKQAELDSLRLALRTNDVHSVSESEYLSYADFDLSDRVIKEEVQVMSSGLQDLGDGWYRCWFISNPQSVVENLKITVYLLDKDGNANFTDIDSGGLYVSGVQLLEDAQLKPYIRSNEEFPGYTVTVNGAWSIV
ncbi:phage head spike fiber domain-containing protein [Curvivirga sp.]|uniref:phage head spike fiber domain-containing protein n=1 Tax=Curvivirga sp. TaxID=2856848 RepID=UPI003B5A3D32